MLEKKDKINKNSPIPLYYQLKDLILSEIKAGNYKSGDLIPTENEMSDAFKISRTTVRQAVTELVQEGYLYRVKSKGTFVSRPKISQEFIRKIESFHDEILRSGMTPYTEVLELKILRGTDANPDVLKALELDKTEDVIYLYRRRGADTNPIVTVRTYLPYRECAFLMDHNLQQEQMYTVLNQKDETSIFRIERTVEAREAKAEDIKLLNMKRGKPILYFESIGFNAYSKPIEYSLSRYRGDSNKFQVTVFP